MKTIRLAIRGRGKIAQIAFVSDEDAVLTNQSWHLSKLDSGEKKYNYVCSHNSGNPVMLHRVVMERVLGRALQPTEIPQFINGDRLDCRRENLKLSNRAEAHLNDTVRIDNTSGYRGVSWNTKAEKWKVEIRDRGKRIYLGMFDDAKEAHKTYLEAQKNIKERRAA